MAGSLVSEKSGPYRSKPDS